MVAGRADVFIEIFDWKSCFIGRGLGSGELAFRADENAEFMAWDVGLELLDQPGGNAVLFLTLMRGNGRTPQCSKNFKGVSY
jgi:hypothetical protein